IDCVGEGDEKKRVVQEVNKNQLNEYFVFSGLVENMADKYKNSDIYLHVATYEPFGIVFLEAMASKTPIVSLNGKGNMTLLKDRYNSLVVDFQNSNEFADFILLIMDSQQVHEIITDNGQKTAINYDVKNIGKKLFDVYRSLLINN
ncbi:MAG: glycosyltransferase family 4 protein, partial [Nitrososphaeraceae archaeon]|nr:glycosyltransferase family 4 protein [Nitrososphaeraceae archaeon]